MKINSRDLSRLECILKDTVKKEDDIRFIVQQYGFTATHHGPSIFVTFAITYWESEKQTAYVNKRIQEILTEILQPSMNDYVKEKAIHDYIVNHVSYDTSYSNYSLYAALVKGKAVCQGYALLTYRMLKEAGIENCIISGTARGESHAWNMVKIDGRWYHLDTTWNDPVPDIPGRLLYKYYNLSDDELMMDHTWPVDTTEATSNFTKVLQEKIKSDPNKADFYNELLLAIRKSRSQSTF